MTQPDLDGMLDKLAILFAELQTLAAPYDTQIEALEVARADAIAALSFQIETLKVTLTPLRQRRATRERPAALPPLLPAEPKACPCTADHEAFLGHLNAFTEHFVALQLTHQAQTTRIGQLMPRRTAPAPPA